MKISILGAAILASTFFPSLLVAQNKKAGATKHLYIDVHHVGPGKVKFEAVAEAHKKDLATGPKYDVHFQRFWVDETRGDIYCLSSAPSEEAIKKTHGEAHGMLPDHVFMVTEGQKAALKKGMNLYFDVHEMGAGKVTAKAVADAHKKDLATQKKYGVNFIDYWVDEKEGVVMCLAQAKDSSDMIKTHKEAHGLVPNYVMQVKQGQ
jgi:hypothetical protein